MRGISANIMCGQEGYFGTSSFQTILDIDEIRKYPATEYVKQTNIDDIFETEIEDDSECSKNNLIINNNAVNIIPDKTTHDDNYNIDF